jgi:hypothetical protein
MVITLSFNILDSNIKTNIIQFFFVLYSNKLMTFLEISERLYYNDRHSVLIVCL